VEKLRKSRDGFIAVHKERNTILRAGEACYEKYLAAEELRDKEDDLLDEAKVTEQEFKEKAQEFKEKMKLWEEQKKVIKKTKHSAQNQVQLSLKAMGDLQEKVTGHKTKADEQKYFVDNYKLEVDALGKQLEGYDERAIELLAEAKELKKQHDEATAKMDRSTKQFNEANEQYEKFKGKYDEEEKKYTDSQETIAECEQQSVKKATKKHQKFMNKAVKQKEVIRQHQQNIAVHHGDMVRQEVMIKKQRKALNEIVVNIDSYDQDLKYWKERVTEPEHANMIPDLEPPPAHEPEAPQALYRPEAWRQTLESELGERQFQCPYCEVVLENPAYMQHTSTALKDFHLSKQEYSIITWRPEEEKEEEEEDSEAEGEEAEAEGEEADGEEADGKEKKGKKGGKEDGKKGKKGKDGKKGKKDGKNEKKGDKKDKKGGKKGDEKDGDEEEKQKEEEVPKAKIITTSAVMYRHWRWSDCAVVKCAWNHARDPAAAGYQLFSLGVQPVYLQEAPKWQHPLAHSVTWNHEHGRPIVKPKKPEIEIWKCVHCMGINVMRRGEPELPHYPTGKPLMMFCKDCGKEYIDPEEAKRKQEEIDRARAEAEELARLRASESPQQRLKREAKEKKAKRAKERQRREEKRTGKRDRKKHQKKEKVEEVIETDLLAMWILFAEERKQEREEKNAVEVARRVRKRKKREDAAALAKLEAEEKVRNEAAYHQAKQDMLLGSRRERLGGMLEESYGQHCYTAGDSGEEDCEPVEATPPPPQ
jgi:hypothetical protein